MLCSASDRPFNVVCVVCVIYLLIEYWWLIFRLLKRRTRKILTRLPRNQSAQPGQVDRNIDEGLFVDHHHNEENQQQNVVDPHHGDEDNNLNNNEGVVVVEDIEVEEYEDIVDCEHN